MNELETLTTFYEELATLVDAGREADAQAYLSAHMRELPEDMRKELLTRMYLSEIVNEASELEATAQAQAQAITAFEALELLKEALDERASAA